MIGEQDQLLLPPGRILNAEDDETYESIGQPNY